MRLSCLHYYRNGVDTATPKCAFCVKREMKKKKITKTNVRMYSGHTTGQILLCVVIFFSSSFCYNGIFIVLPYFLSKVTNGNKR
jgi:hypothetical protein